MTSGALCFAADLVTSEGPATWVNTTALGLLAIFVGFLLKKLVPAIEELGKKLEGHVDRFSELLAKERDSHVLIVDKICETFKAEIRAEREAADRRMNQVAVWIKKEIRHASDDQS